MPVATTLRRLDMDEAQSLVDSGGSFIDLRDVESYLDVHIPGSIGLLYEFGPGFNSRARDCIPLDVPLVLLDLGTADMSHAAASLRGKGFDVAGKLDDGINKWIQRNGPPASTEVVKERPAGMTLLHVNDPGTADIEADLTIPIEKLWSSADEVPSGPVAVAAGFGVRAAIAVGILERAGKDVFVWKTRSGR